MRPDIVPRMPRPTLLPSQPIRALIDGLTCLQALVTSEHPCGSRDLSRQLGIPHTRVNRYLRTLAHMGLAQQTPKRKYIAGPALHVLAARSRFRSQLAQRTVEVLAGLKDEGAIVAVGMLWGPFVCYLYHISRENPDDPLGQTQLWPATQSSIGMFLLAQQADDEVRALYAGGAPEPYETIDELLGDLETIRREGHALLVRPAFLAGSVAVGIGQPPLAAAAVLLNDRGDAPRVLGRLREAARQIAEPFAT